MLCLQLAPRPPSAQNKSVNAALIPHFRFNLFLHKYGASDPLSPSMTYCALLVPEEDKCSATNFLPSLKVLYVLIKKTTKTLSVQQTYTFQLIEANAVVLFLLLKSSVVLSLKIEN